MLRTLIIILVVLLPTALAVFYLWLRPGRELPAWLARGPWIWLLVAGIALAVSALVAWGLAGAPPDSTYVPPHMEDGRIVPGTYVPRAD
ncbi:MAG: hypothetical protein H6842_07905 [Rhodospirillaceae bacterium]|nr:hypothetical protein [Rhodospirillaceae bacterium]